MNWLKRLELLIRLAILSNFIHMVLLNKDYIFLMSILNTGETRSLIGAELKNVNR